MNQFRGTPTPQSITHGQTGVFATREAEASQGPGRITPALTLRAAWTRFRRAERQFSSSIWGDVLGVISLAIMFGGLLYAPLLWE
ncbi:hypothetical protein [Phaeobacter sp. B1627]|uniref:hypothetical protein n=1 Tax=Phaeobacter sp. B1627 TaxID=2583809 RepID=UPI00111B36DF|nr:hypothetical protein [Phaeobacter sp. B1627]TNJ40468.1 hypothetical protein FGE21_17785 [Phaeobacter sp. B1627]